MKAYGIDRIAAYYSTRHGSRYSQQRELARRALKKSERQMANRAVRNLLKDSPK